MRPVALRHARGFTLIELMVAVTIGLLLTVAIAQLFIGSRRSYATSDDLSRMQENMRYAHDVLSRTIRMSGYMSAPTRFSVDTDSYLGVFAAGNNALTGTDGNAGSSLTTVTNPDTLTVRYQGTSDAAGVADGVTVDCTGQPVAADVISTNIFSIVKDVPTNKSSLVCQTVAGGAVTVLVEDVENMQILYGEEKNGDFTADAYVPADLVADMNRVVSLRIALLFRTANLRVRSDPDTNTYKMHGGTVAAPTAVGDENTRIRRVMTATIALRNRTP
jgi:type IV pilus assembly protein PilW